jgi:hypothetical protein
MKLKQPLFDEYGGFADKRIKRLERSSLFIVDDRSAADHGADRQLFLWFCLIFAEVVSDTEVRISLRGRVPIGAAVEIWISKNKAGLGVKSGKELSFTIKKGKEAHLTELADAVASIVGSNKRYAEKAYKYVCPRTSRSLKRLARTLKQAWAGD